MIDELAEVSEPGRQSRVGILIFIRLRIVQLSILVGALAAHDCREHFKVRLAVRSAGQVAEHAAKPADRIE